MVTEGKPYDDIALKEKGEKGMRYLDFRKRKKT